MPEDRPIQMKWGKFHGLPSKTLCNECPLRVDSEPGNLGGWTPTMYIRGMHAVPDFACHMSRGFNQQDLEQMRSCTGVANFRCNTGIVDYLPPGNSKTAALHAGPDLEKVFATAADFFHHHTVKDKRHD